MIDPAERDRIIFGCGNFGGLGSSPTYRDKGDDRERALAMLDTAREWGLTRFDTANTYGGGASEMILGEWLSKQDKAFRARLQIATKVGNPHGCPPDDRPLSRTQVAYHLDRSLRRLGLEQIGLYYLHEFDPQTPLEETLEALDRALAQGKIAAFGVSNASLADLKTVLALSSGALRRAFTHLQNEYNLLVQRDLNDVIPLCRAESIRYVAFSPLAGGLLSGKYRQDQQPQSGRMNAARAMYEHLLTASSFDMIETLKRTAAENGWTVPGAALRFILDTPGTDLIIAPRSHEQFAGYGIARA
ncbi:MAG: aldo/keto reductase [Alphaproteobacteria bacterium]|nr:aldo/keto reductase [Alphaproteobacteria bacterium]